MKILKTEQLRKIVKRNGFKLVKGHYGKVKNGEIECGCILTHLYCAEHKNQPIKDDEVDVNRIDNWANKTIGKVLSSNLVNSFDGTISKKEIKETYKKNLQKYALAGFDLGQRARNLL